MAKKFQKATFSDRLGSMLRVDCRRMFLAPTFYITLGIALVMPVLILVMTTMMDGSVTVDPQTGVETVVEGFDNVWQAIGPVSGTGLSMDMTGMCNINLIYFMVIVLVSLFVSDDFRSGYCKNLFAIRAGKSDYVISKTIVCVMAGVALLLVFFVGAMLGGAVAGLPFAMEGFNTGNLVMCMLAKCFMMLVFVPICLLCSSFAKSKTWLSMVLGFGGGMLLFTMIPMITPLNATAMNVLLCAAGGLCFSIGLGIASKTVLTKKDIL